MMTARATILTLLCIVAAALGGCASGGAYPTLPGLGGLGQKTLTPEEQDAKIKQLAGAQGAAGGTVQPAVLQQ
jgi:hypothetical protein